MSSKVCLFFVVDGPKLEAQSVILAASIAKHIPDYVEVVAYHREDYLPSELNRELLTRCGVSFQTLTGTGKSDQSPWKRAWPVGNKLIAKAQRRDCEISVYLDTDMMIRKRLDFAAELGENDVLACTADYLFGEMHQDETWSKLYDFFAVPMPEERRRLLAGKRLNLPPYYNGGFVIFRERETGKAAEHFGEAWLKDCIAIEHTEGLDFARPGLDQTILPVSIERLGVKFQLGRQALNFNVRAHGFKHDSDIAIAHYHQFSTILRFYPTLGLEACENIDSVLGRDALHAFIDYYGSVMEWRRPRFKASRLIDAALDAGNPIIGNDPSSVNASVANRPRPSLTELADKYGSDKGRSKHRYTELYDMLFAPFRDQEINMLEMGLLVGGPEVGKDKDRKTTDSPSVNMWLDYFSKAIVHGLDISDFSWIKNDRFRFYRCDMDQREYIAVASADMPTMDIIIDDASHASHHQQNGFLELFPKLKDGGLYIIEDLRWQPSGMERDGITKTGELFGGFQIKRRFSHSDAQTEAAFNALAKDISGCFVLQEGYNPKRRTPIAVIHKK